MSSILAQAPDLLQVVDAGTPDGQTAEIVLFWILAVIGIGAGIAMVMSSNIVHAALLLVVNFFAISGLYLVLESSFLSIVQIIVYAGAIMILFLFVIMLLGVDRDDLLLRTGNRVQQGVAAFAALVLAGMLITLFVGTYTTPDSSCGALANTVDVDPDNARCVGLAVANASEDSGSVGVIGQRLFTRYVFPFESSAILLTVATIGALVLGRREDPELEAEEVALPIGHREPDAEGDADAASDVPATPAPLEAAASSDGEVV